MKINGFSVNFSVKLKCKFYFLEKPAGMHQTLTFRIKVARVIKIFKKRYFISFLMTKVLYCISIDILY